VNDDPVITSRPDGPLMVNGPIPLFRTTAVRSEPGQPPERKTSQPPADEGTYALCRCGLSTNRPFCDGTHKREGFVVEETAARSHDEPVQSPDDPDPDQIRHIAVIDDGPLRVVGAIPIRLSDGALLANSGQVTLCRCGSSENKPLCDGSHARIQFREGKDDW